MERVPGAIEGKTLAESGIGARTGLNVIAVRIDGESVTNPSADAELLRGAELVMLGTVGQPALRLRSGESITACESSCFALGFTEVRRVLSPGSSARSVTETVADRACCVETISGLLRDGMSPADMSRLGAHASSKA